MVSTLSEMAAISFCFLGHLGNSSIVLIKEAMLSTCGRHPKLFALLASWVPCICNGEESMCLFLLKSTVEYGDTGPKAMPHLLRLADLLWSLSIIQEELLSD